MINNRKHWEAEELLRGEKDKTGDKKEEICHISVQHWNKKEKYKWITDWKQQKYDSGQIEDDQYEVGSKITYQKCRRFQVQVSRDLAAENQFCEDAEGSAHVWGQKREGSAVWPWCQETMGNPHLIDKSDYAPKERNWVDFQNTGKAF